MRVRKIVIICIMMILISNVALAKYIYEFSETIAILSRDTMPLYASCSYSMSEWTNQNVIVKISCNKEIEQVSGFELSEDKKQLSKEFSENSSGKVKIRDLSGNETEIEYNVNNIDKEMPQIVGCENDGIYEAPLILDYSDNQAIKSVEIDRYSENLQFSLKRQGLYIITHVDEHPLNTVKYKYYINDNLYSTVNDEKYIFTGLEKNKNYKVKVQALDSQGNILAEKMQEVEDIELLEEAGLEEKDNFENDIYFITRSGNYQIKVADLAGNELSVNIKVK